MKNTWLVSTDAGRAKVYPGETRDCAVRAFALAFNIDYATTHAFFRAHGRKLQHRTKDKTLLAVLSATQAQPLTFLRGYTLFKLLGERTHGTFIVYVRGHVFTVKDGLVHDLPTKMLKTGSKIQNVWLIKLNND